MLPFFFILPNLFILRFCEIPLYTPHTTIFSLWATLSAGQGPLFYFGHVWAPRVQLHCWIQLSMYCDSGRVHSFAFFFSLRARLQCSNRKKEHNLILTYLNNYSVFITLQQQEKPYSNDLTVYILFTNFCS